MPVLHHPRRALVQTLGVFAIAAATAAWLGCDRTADKPADAESSMPSVLVVSGDTGPWITPCGCTSNQSGGLPRRGTFIADQDKTAKVVYLDAGGAVAGTTQYFRTKFEAVLTGEMLMGLAAHNLGGPELALGPAALREIAERTKAPFVSANAVAADAGSLAPPVYIVTSAGRRFAVVGVVSPKYATADVRVTDPRQAVVDAAKSFAGQFDSLVVLAYLPDEELQELAAALPEADAVIGGPTGQAQAPKSRGPTLVGAATNKGKFLIQLNSPAKAGAGEWSGSVVELGTAYADDPRQTANVNAYLDRLKQIDFAAADTGLVAVPQNAPGDFRVAGNASCMSCHQAEHASWAASRHAHANETLVARGGFAHEPYCLQCHTTGYAMPGGFSSPTRTPGLGGVGCESCHGPSVAHVARPMQIRTPYNAFDQCVRCHDHDNSPAFERGKYWAKIFHGKPKSSGGSS